MADEAVDSWLVEQALAGRGVVVLYEFAHHIDSHGRRVDHRLAFASASAVIGHGSPYRAFFNDAVPAHGVDVRRDLRGKVLVVPERDGVSTVTPIAYRDAVVVTRGRHHKILVGRLRLKSAHRRGPGQVDYDVQIVKGWAST